jgi:hypothetical protein
LQPGDCYHDTQRDISAKTVYSMRLNLAGSKSTVTGYTRSDTVPASFCAGTLLASDHDGNTLCTDLYGCVHSRKQQSSVTTRFTFRALSRSTA